METKYKLTILGDSSTFPRPNDNVLIDNTYPMVLGQSKNLVVLNRSKISVDTDYFLESQQIHYDVIYSNSEYFIINLGICDCSPRIFSKKQKKILDLLLDIPYLAKLVRGYMYTLSSNRLHHTKKRRIVNVEASKFSENIKQLIKLIKENNPVKKIFLVNIICPSKNLSERSYGLADLVVQYNGILNEISQDNKDLVELIDLYKYTNDNQHTITPDGHHFNSEGHSFIANKVLKRLAA